MRRGFTMGRKVLGKLLLLLFSLMSSGLVQGMDRSNFFQDKFCDIFCPSDGSQPRLTLTDEQIQIILESDEIIQMLEENPGLLHGDDNLDMACLIEFNREQRESILAQFGGFFSSSEESEKLREYPLDLVREAGQLGQADKEALDEFKERAVPSEGQEGYQNEDWGEDNSNAATEEQDTNTEDNTLGHFKTHTSLNQNTINHDSSNYDSSSYGSSNSGSSSGGYYYRWYYGSGSDSRRRRRRKRKNAARRRGRRDLDKTSDRWTAEQKQNLIADFIKKSKIKQSMRKKRAARFKRSDEEGYLEVCRVDQKYEDFQLALTIDGGVVQIAQFPEVQLHQWFLKEKCLEPTSSIIPSIQCKKRSRFVKAIVLPLNIEESLNVTSAMIEIESCAAVLTSSFGVEEASIIAQPPESSTTQTTTLSLPASTTTPST